MTISIVTPHSVYNYGAVLQAKGLYQYLKGQNHDVYMQSFPPHVAGKPASLHEKIYETGTTFFGKVYAKKLCKGNKNFDVFISEFEETDRTDCSLYILGSDQVWNPTNLDKYFTLEFASEKSRKISYAASMGVSNFPKEKEKLFLEMTDRLDFLSAREAQTAKETERITGRKCSVNVDPTFLVSSEYWKNIVSPLDINKPYILIYLLHIPSNINSIIKSVKEKYGYNAYIIDRSGFLHFISPFGVKGVFEAGPNEFLWLVNNAEFVITSSFHGTAFSLIFNKQFVSLVNPASPSRIKNLLNISGLQSYGIAPGEKICFKEIDYSFVKKNLEVYIAESKEYLSKAIGEENE